MASADFFLGLAPFWKALKAFSTSSQTGAFTMNYSYVHIPRPRPLFHLIGFFLEPEEVSKRLKALKMHIAQRTFFGVGSFMEGAGSYKSEHVNPRSMYTSPFHLFSSSRWKLSSDSVSKIGVGSRTCHNFESLDVMKSCCRNKKRNTWPRLLQ